MAKKLKSLVKSNQKPFKKTAQGDVKYLVRIKTDNRMTVLSGTLYRIIK